MDGSDQPRDDREIVRGRDGKPLRDRYGRPIYRRSAQPRRDASPADDPRQRFSGRPRTPEGYLTRADVEELRRLRERGLRPGEGHHAEPRRRPDRSEGHPAGPRRRPAPSDAPPRRPRSSDTRVFQRPDDLRGDRPLYRGQDDPRFPPRGYDPDRGYADHPDRPRDDRTRRLDDYDGRDDAARRRGRGRRKALDDGRRPDRRLRSRRPRNLGFTIKSFLLVLLLVAGAGAMWVDFNLNRVDAFPDGDRPGRTMASNWLIVGSDSRDGLTDEDAANLATGAGDFGQRTDTIMIAHFPFVGKGRLVSLPRDSYVDIPGHGQNKINAAYSFGGARLLAETIEHNTGIRIDHYAEIGFGGFASIVDAMGGIEMCPTEAIQDPLAGLDIEAGCQKFDGATGLGYVRTRATAQGDLDRVARQREFMGAMVDRVSSPAVWLNPWRWYRLGSAGAKALTVDSGDHVWHLGWLMLRMALGTESETVPTAGTMDTDHAGNVLLWDDAAAPAFFDGLK